MIHFYYKNSGLIENIKNVILLLKTCTHHMRSLSLQGVHLKSEKEEREITRQGVNKDYCRENSALVELGLHIGVNHWEMFVPK